MWNARPHPSPLPRGEGIANNAFNDLNDFLANPAIGFFARQKRFSLSPRERAGVRGKRGYEGNEPIHGVGLVADVGSTGFCGFVFSFTGTATTSFTSGTYGCSGLNAMMLIGGRVNSAE